MSLVKFIMYVFMYVCECVRNYVLCLYSVHTHTGVACEM